MSLSQSAVANKLRLLKLSYEEQKLILETDLTERHARAILRLENNGKRVETIRHISDNRMNVQASERYIEGLLEEEEKQRSAKSGNGKKGRMDQDVFQGEKMMMEMVQSLRRRVDGWNKSGRRASIQVENGAKVIEVTICLSK